MAVDSQRLVIDASVAGATGFGKKDAPLPMDSIACRKFLNDVLTICHRMVFTDKIADEWKRHGSPFARHWRRRMEGKKKVLRVDINDSTMLARIKKRKLEKPIEAIVNKDAHLVASAIGTDGFVVSLDDRAMNNFRKSVLTEKERRDLVWINPRTKGAMSMIAKRKRH